jgi:general secretion pathway protein K
MITSMPTYLTRQHAPNGFVVVAVLWILGALAALVSVYNVYVIDTAAAFTIHDERFRAESLASAAIELVAYQLTKPAQTRLTHGQFDFRMDQANVAVEFRSEAARIDLNVAPKELLAGLFATRGAHRAKAENYANRIVAWRTNPPKGNESEALAYLTAGLRYVPRGAPFPHVSELPLVLDLPIALVERVLPFVTVYSGRPQVNIFDAAPEVIAALPGMARDRLDAFLAQRQTTPGNGQILMPLLGPSQTYATAESSKASRITVRVTFDNGHRLTSEVVVLVFEEGTEPYSILSWRDKLNESEDGQ